MSTSNAVTNLYALYFGLQAPDNGAITSNTNNINESKFSSLSVRLNSTTIRSFVNLANRADISEMNKVFPNNSITSYKAHRFGGFYGILLDSEPHPTVYNGTDLKGIPLSPSNDLMATFTATTSNNSYTHQLFALYLRVFYFKNGTAYSYPI